MEGPAPAQALVATKSQSLSQADPVVPQLVILKHQLIVTYSRDWEHHIFSHLRVKYIRASLYSKSQRQQLLEVSWWFVGRNPHPHFQVDELPDLL